MILIHTIIRIQSIGYSPLLHTIIRIAILGVLRLEKTRDTARTNMQHLELQSMIKRTPNVSEQDAKTYLKVVDDKITFLLDRAYRHYRQRNWCMLLGLTGYIALKVGAAYLPTAGIPT